MGLPNPGNQVLHDPKHLKVNLRRSRQLNFPVEQPDAPKPKVSRPIAIAERLDLEVQALRQHFERNPEFWGQIALRDSRLENSAGASVSVELASFFSELRGRIDVATSLPPDLRPLIQSGVQFLVTQLNSQMPDYGTFRALWLLLWPIFNDCGWVETLSPVARVALQGMISKSF